MLWCTKVRKHVPCAKGPYVPGCCDIMTDYSKTGMFLRVFYPTDYNHNINNYQNQWIKWLPDDSYLLGFANILKLWLFIVKLVIWLFSGTLYVPVIYGAKVKPDKIFKTIIFSHGLGGHRFLYTGTCIELASQGFVVFATEHRDESPCRTYYYKNKSDVEKDKKTFIEHSVVKLGNDHYKIRNGQVLKRSLECRRVFELLLSIQKGVLPPNILEDLPSEKSKNVQFNLKQLVGRMDVENITMMGHSFGAATSIVTLANEPRLKQGILLDPWMFPIKNMTDTISEVKQPLLFINTQTFHIESNVKKMETLKGNNEEERPMYTIKHTTHESQTDSVFVVGYWMNWFMKKLKPETGMRINNALILRYLNRYTGVPDNISEFEEYLNKENCNFYSGLTKPWA